MHGMEAFPSGIHAFSVRCLSDLLPAISVLIHTSRLDLISCCHNTLYFTPLDSLPIVLYYPLPGRAQVPLIENPPWQR